MAETLVDLVTRKVLDQVNAGVRQLNEEIGLVKIRADQAISEAVDRVETEGRARLGEFMTQIPTTPMFDSSADDFDPFGWIKAQAKSRALRTLVQGGLAAVVIAFVTAVVQQVVDPNFDFTQFSDWKIAIGLGLGAVGTAASSYLQNKLAIKPPKAQ